MSHIVKLGSAATVGAPLLTALAITQTGPGVQTASRGTGATIINPGNEPEWVHRLFQRRSQAFPKTWSKSLASRRGNNSYRRGTLSSRLRSEG
jgi:hypothetical protein